MVENEWCSLRSDHEVLRPSGRLDAVPELWFLEILPVKIPGRRAAGDGGGHVPEPGAESVRGARRAPEDVVLPGVRDDG